LNGVSSGNGSFSSGQGCTSSGVNAFSTGEDNVSDSLNSVTFGNLCRTNGVIGVMMHGRDGFARAVATPVFTPDYSFQLAGGNFTSAPGPGTDGMGLALTTQIFGPNPTANGIADAWINGGFDVAEYWEWADGGPADNATEEEKNRFGYFVNSVDEDGRIGIAVDNDVVGITSATAGVVGNAAELHWHDANLKDEFLRPVTRDSYLIDLRSTISSYVRSDLRQELIDYLVTQNDDSQLAGKAVAWLQAREVDTAQFASVVANLGTKRVHVPNPNFDPSVPYDPRSARKEWIVVGMLGKIVVRCDPSVTAGSKVDCLNGIAVPGTRWRVLKKISNTTVLIMFRL